MIYKDYQFRQVMKNKTQKGWKKDDQDNFVKVIIFPISISILLLKRLQKKIWNQAYTTVHNLVLALGITKILQEYSQKLNSTIKKEIF